MDGGKSASAQAKMDDSGIAVVGAGLVGSLLALFLAKRGFKVDVFERRADMRSTEKVAAGRSYQFSCTSTRGITALQTAPDFLKNVLGPSCADVWSHDAQQSR